MDEERLDHPMPRPDCGAQQQQGAAAVPKRAISIFVLPAEMRCQITDGVPPKPPRNTCIRWEPNYRPVPA